MNLYELNVAYQNILDLDLTEEELLLTMESLKGTIKDKAENIGMVLNSLQAEQLVYKTEITRLQAKMKASSNKYDNLKQYLSDGLKEIGIDKLEGKLFKFSFRKSTSVIIDDEKLIPTEFTEIVSTIKIDKKDLKEHLKTSEISGCHLDVKQNLQIK